MSPEISKDDLAEIRDDIKEIKTDVKQGFEKMNGRVKKLEIKDAFNSGADSVIKGVSNGDDWKKATFKLIALIGGIVALASTAAGIVAQVVLK